MSEEHDCMYGVGEEYGGGLRWYTKKTVKNLNPTKDTTFDFCPICGKKLASKEGLRSDFDDGYKNGYRTGFDHGYNKGRGHGRDEYINRYHDMGR